MSKSTDLRAVDTRRKQSYNLPPQIEDRRELRDTLPWWPGFVKTARKFLRNPLSATGIGLILVFVAIALLAPWLAPPRQGLDPLLIPQDTSIRSSFPVPPNMDAWNTFPPDWKLHPLGTTGSSQFDLYYGVIWGTRTSFEVAVIIVGLSLLVGLLIGSVAGFTGGIVDDFLMRVVDIFLALPFLVLVVVLSIVLGTLPYINILGLHITIAGVWIVVAAIILVNWVTYARLVRGDMLSAREKDYVQAARAAGASNRRIIFRHLLPNIIYPVLIYASLDFGSQVVTVAALSFLGLGSPLGYADWGQLVNNAQGWVGGGTQYWFVLAVPAVAISLFVLAFNLIGDAVRDIFDPHLQKR
ncbi:ABC transporter permease [Candidatus Acetothermia bacterium]|nr:ABC transporter permease [Candidatus Acetothermia bacterium]MBI3643346.1 ABC transporter permease [Candidatus Acetothermia bacterium]